MLLLGSVTEDKVPSAIGVESLATTMELYEPKGALFCPSVTIFGISVPGGGRAGDICPNSGKNSG